ncbi:MAG: cobaltochelatase subunit CobN [Planctomycetaceae bacterium]|jgi:cobaltochelatase CobN|nr:cobaltochelatase subunit CobN [Planctomycetaceae bacterium]
MLKKILSIAMTFILLAGFAYGAYSVYHYFLCPIRIGVIMATPGDANWLAYKEAAEGTVYSVHRIPKNKVATMSLENYDILFLWGMGWQPTDEEIANVNRAKAKGTAVYVGASTKQSTKEMNNLSEDVQKKIGEYLGEGDVENIRAMYKYIAHELKGHRVTVPDVAKKPKRGYFHLDSKLYETLDEYEKYLDERYPNFTKDSPRVALLGPFINAYDKLERKPIDDIVKKLADKGMRVYCIMGFGTTKMLEECHPDAAIAFSHGRMAANDEAVKLLSRLNIPCLNAINIMEQKENWLKEPTAMSGGYMSQSIVMSELDGIIEPTAIAAMETNEDNLTLRTPIPERIDMITRRIENWIALKRKPNAEKKIVIVYYKAPGHSALTASGMETIDSLYNTLCRMKAEGYNFGEHFPESSKELNDLIQEQGRTIGQWAVGSMEEFVDAGRPELVPAEDYAKWLESDVPKPNRDAIIKLWGNVPGKQMTIQKEDKPYLLVTRIQLGNIVLMPQPSTAIINESDEKDATEEQKSDAMTAVHGTNQAPPHFYLGAYLWVRHGFQADAIMHFGTHGSLEFTKGKSAVLSDECWPTILIGDLPHIYPYIINNIGEAMVAKRRSSAVIVTHLTPPFTKSELYGDLDVLKDKLHEYNTVEGDALKNEILKTITQLVKSNDLYKEIGYKTNPPEAKNDGFLLPTEKLELLEEYLEAVQYADITEGLHVIGRDWTEQQIQDTVVAMLGDTGLERIDAVREKLATQHSESADAIPEGKQDAVKWFVSEVLEGHITKEMIATIKPEEKEEKTEEEKTTEESNEKPQESSEEKKSGEKPETDSKDENVTNDKTDDKQDKNTSNEIDKIDKVNETKNKPSGHPMNIPKNGMPPNMPKSGGTPPADMPAMKEMMEMMGMNPNALAPKKDEPEDKPSALFDAVERHVENLKSSIPAELDSIITSLGGGYVKPSSGGDPIINPDAVPTGRNMASINVEQTPSPESYKIAQKLTDQIIEDFRDSHNGEYPRRIACTFWGGEYLRTRGVVLAQALYLMGLKPRRDSRGIVFDVEVIPSEELGRPRIDIVAQTSGQFRDAALSRIELLDKAVIKVSELPDEKFPNFVKQHSHETELTFKKEGLSAAQAREYSTARIFGSPSGNYGTGIMGTVSRSETENSAQVADRYIQNMSGMYRSGKIWGVPVKGLLESQLQGTDLMIMSRSSNTWGPLSLDHVYEFNTLALAVREKTGTDPGIWFSDLRNGSRPRAATAVSAIREEARTTMWNPKYIRGLQKEGASGAAAIVEPIRNMQGWNFIQPDTIDESLWDETYKVYIEDKHQLDMKAYFEEKSPYALQDLTAVMLETIRKGMWKPSEDVIKNLADLHVEMVEKYGAGCSADTCGNMKLHAFLGQHTSANVSLEQYQSALNQVLQSRKPAPEVEGMQLEETKIIPKTEKRLFASAPFFISLIVLTFSFVFLSGFVFCRKNPR